MSWPSSARGSSPGAVGAAIAAHLAGCARCTAADDQLAGVSALLADGPGPGHAGQRGAAARRGARRRGSTAGIEAERAGARHSRDRRRAPRPAGGPLPARDGRACSSRPPPWWYSPRAGTVSASSAASRPPLPRPRPDRRAGTGRSVRGTLRGAGERPGAKPVGAAPRRPGVQRSALGLVPNGTFLPATLQPQLEAALRAPAATRAAPHSSAAARACVRRLTSGVSPGT